MKAQLLLALAVIAPLLSGCLTDESGPATVDSGTPGVAAGDALEPVLFEATGRIMTPDPLAGTCEQFDQGCAIHEWTIPGTSADGVAQRTSAVTIELHPTSPTSVDLDLFVYDAKGNELDASVSTEPLATERVSLGALPAQTLVIKVAGFAGAAMDYHIAGEAQMVATESTASTTAAAGDVTISKEGDRYIARRTVTYDYPVASNAGDATASTGAGALSFIATGSDYHLSADLAGRGDTEQQARDRLEEIRIDHGFDDGARLDIDVHARPGNGGWNDKEATLRFEVPTGISWGRVNMDTIAGSVVVRNLNVDSLHAGTTAGSVTASAVAVGDMELDSTAGSITADVRAPLRSGNWQLDSTAGAIDLDLVEGNDIGYSVDARTDAGSVRFHFDDAPTTSTDCEYASCHMTAQTNGYDGRSVKVVVNLDTSAGSISAGS